MAPSGGGFDVETSALDHVGGRLGTAGDEVASVGRQAAAGARDAGAACGGGPLQRSLSLLGAQLEGRADLMSSVLAAADSALRQSATTYRRDDGAAAAGVGAVSIPGLGSAPVGPGGGRP